MNRTPLVSFRRLLLPSLALLLPPLALTSCAEKSKLGIHRETYERFKVADEPHDPNFWTPHLDPILHGAPNPTRKQLIDGLGQPDEKRQEADGGETLVWNNTPGKIRQGVEFSVLGVDLNSAPVVAKESTEARFGPGDGAALNYTDQMQGVEWSGIGLSRNIEDPIPEGMHFKGTNYTSRRRPVDWEPGKDGY